MKKGTHHQDQLGFEALLLDADRTNHERKLEDATRHLPATMAHAVPFLWELLEEHHAAMLAGQVDEVMFCREEAHRLAVKLNGGKAGILAADSSPGYVLARETAAAPGAVPLWGQKASFTVNAAGARVRIEMDGVFGLFATTGFWLSFSAYAVDFERPFISETGYRSFLGLHAEPVPGITPDVFAEKVIAGHVAREMKGRLVAIETRYRDRAAA
jgi:hypothetical protein